MKNFWKFSEIRQIREKQRKKFENSSKTWELPKV